jgi:hypothetical protein
MTADEVANSQSDPQIVSKVYQYGKQTVTRKYVHKEFGTYDKIKELERILDQFVKSGQVFKNKTQAYHAYIRIAVHPFSFNAFNKHQTIWHASGVLP